MHVRALERRREPGGVVTLEPTNDDPRWVTVELVALPRGEHDALFGDGPGAGVYAWSRLRERLPRPRCAGSTAAASSSNDRAVCS